MTGKRARKPDTAAGADTGAPQAGPGSSARPSANPAEAQTDVQLAPFVVPDDAVVRRTKDGWRGGSADLPDLTSAMILADLRPAETATAEAGAAKPAGACQ